MPKLALNYGHGADTYEKKRSKFVIVGGKVYEEHTFNAAVGEKVKKIVEAHGVEVKVIQPPNGSDIPLQKRIDTANAWLGKTGLWLGIHANAANDKTADGVCAFYWGTSADGKRAAESYVKYAKEEGLPLYHGGLWGSVEGTWNAFDELEKTKMTAILSENGFMTNPEDFKGIFLNANGYHDKIARINAKMVLDYFKIKYDKNKDITIPKPKPVVQPAPPKPPVKDVAGSDKYIHRVIVDGKQVGAYGAASGVVSEVEKAVKSGAKKITIERTN